MSAVELLTDIRLINTITIIGVGITQIVSIILLWKILQVLRVVRRIAAK